MSQPQKLCIPCEAGRRLGASGWWVAPCPAMAYHGIQSPELPPIYLCDFHFYEMLMAGKITEPNVGRAEFDRRESVRIAQAPNGEHP